MDLECLKIAANEIKMPQDMKERIIDATRRSCAVNRKQKEAHYASKKVPDSSKQN